MGELGSDEVGGGVGRVEVGSELLRESRAAFGILLREGKGE